MHLSHPIIFEGIYTDRIKIRPVKVSDFKIMHDALRDTIKLLQPWMPWAQSLASLEDTESYLRHGEILWSHAPQPGVEMPLQILDKTDKVYIGATGIKPVNFDVPSFEIGYWINRAFMGQGYITEAMNALSRFIFTEFNAKRIEINCEEHNVKSYSVAKRLNYHFEGALKNSRMTGDGKHVTSSLIYACYDINDLPPLKCQWRL